MQNRNFDPGKQKRSFGVVSILIFGGLILATMAWEIYAEDRSGSIERSLWEWLDLFLIPLLLILLIPGVNWITRKAQERQVQLNREMMLDDQRDNALRSYMDLMTDLIFEKGLTTQEEHGELRELARVYTLDVLRCLDGARKGRVLRFLLDADLIDSDNAIIELRGADLKGIQLEGANLRRISLSEADLRGAHLDDEKLSGAKLMDVDFRGGHLKDAELIEADLRRGKMNGIDLRGAILTRANLHMAELEAANLRQAYLEGANLEGVKLVNADLSGAYLMDSSLQKACLRDVNLNSAYLDSADLSECDLSGANLENTILSKAILMDARVSDLQLDTVKSLKKAVLPNRNREV